MRTTPLMGHSEDVAQWLEQANPFPDVKDIDGWLEEATTKLSSYPVANDSPRVFKVLTLSSTFRLERTWIPPSHIGLLPGRNFKLVLPADEPELREAVEKRQLVPSVAWIIYESRCDKCGASYIECPCSKVIDSGVVQRVEKGDIAYCFWTDRPA